MNMIDYYFFKLLGSYSWERLSERYSGLTLFGSGATWTDVEQGYAGTCYILASMGALAEFP